MWRVPAEPWKTDWQEGMSGRWLCEWPQDLGQANKLLTSASWEYAGLSMPRPSKVMTDPDVQAAWNVARQ